MEWPRLLRWPVGMYLLPSQHGCQRERGECSMLCFEGCGPGARTNKTCSGAMLSTTCLTARDRGGALQARCSKQRTLIIPARSLPPRGGGTRVPPLMPGLVCAPCLALPLALALPDGGSVGMSCSPQSGLAAVGVSRRASRRCCMKIMHTQGLASAVKAKEFMIVSGCLCSTVFCPIESPPEG